MNLGPQLWVGQITVAETSEPVSRQSVTRTGCRCHRQPLGHPHSLWGNVTPGAWSSGLCYPGAPLPQEPPSCPAGLGCLCLSLPPLSVPLGTAAALSWRLFGVATKKVLGGRVGSARATRGHSRPFSQMGIPAGPRKELLLSHWDVVTVAALSGLRVSVTVLTLSPKPTLL